MIFENVLQFKLTGDIKFLQNAVSDEEKTMHEMIQPESVKVAADLGAYNGFVLVLPSQLKTIGASAFAYCWNFLYVVIPESVESVGYDAFGSAFCLTIYCEAKERPEGWDAYWAHSAHTVVWGYVASEA